MKYHIESYYIKLYPHSYSVISILYLPFQRPYVKNLPALERTVFTGGHQRDLCRGTGFGVVFIVGVAEWPPWHPIFRSVQTIKKSLCWLMITGSYNGKYEKFYQAISVQGRQKGFWTLLIWFILELVGGLDHFLFFHILGTIIPTDFHILQRGRYTTKQRISCCITQSWAKY